VAPTRRSGRLLDAVDRAGLADETWLIFTTDHGIAFPGAKSTLYDPGIGVALVMRLPAGWPRPDGASGCLFSHVDLVPAVLDRLGVEVPARVQGVSHARWLAAGDPSPARGEIYAEKNFHDAYDPMRAVRTERYKYIRSFEDRPRLLLALDIEGSPTQYGFGDDHLRRRPPEELYDLHGDPLERHNLAADPDHAEQREELAAMLQRWRVATWRWGQGAGILMVEACREDWSASKTSAGSRSEAMDSIVWIIVAAVLGIAEIFTLTAALGLLAVGALAAAAVAALGLGPVAQFATFAVAAVAGLVVVRPLLRRHLRPQLRQHRFGVAALVGRQAHVTQEVTGHAGRVRIGGKEWSARSYDETLVIPPGATVDVIEIEGATALVYPRE
jgi:membrane protein implicated in regulation of membrane protease activity